MNKLLIKLAFTAFAVLFFIPVLSFGQLKPVKKGAIVNKEKRTENIRKQKKIDFSETEKIKIEKVNSEDYLSWFKIDLFVCKTGNNCSEFGFTNGMVHLPLKDQGKVFKFNWKMDIPSFEGLMWQVSSIAYSENSLETHPPGIIKTGIEKSFYTKDDLFQGSFSIDFGNLVQNALKFSKSTTKGGLKSTIVKSKIQNISLSNSKSKLFFIRIFPVSNGSPEYGASPTIVMRFDDNPDETVIEVLAPPSINFPDLYSIKIAGFSPIIFPTLPWGSTYVTGIDEVKYNNSKNNPSAPQLYNLYKGLLNSQKPIVPSSYTGQGSDGWLESLWNATKSATDWISDAYEWPKDQVVESVAKIIDAVPGLECDADCKAYLKSGIEAGLVSIGVPPSLPNAEQLLEDGLDYIAAQTASQIGCGDLCEDEIKTTLEVLGSELTKSNIGTLKNAEEAHKNGKEPLVIPDWVNVKPAAESGIQPPVLHLELNKNNLKVLQKDSSVLSQYYIKIYSVCKNSYYYKGKKIRVPVNTYNTGAEETDELTLSSDPAAMLWESKLIAIPSIHNGRTLKIPVYLNDVSYLFPGHLELIRNHGGIIRFDDWSSMYSNGEVTFYAEVVVLETDWWTNTANYRTLFKTEAKFQLPNEYKGGYQRQKSIQ